jgi:Putative zinc-finger
MLFRHLSGGELTEYADGEMRGARHRRAQGHLSRCEQCTRALESTWEAAGVLRGVSTAPVPDDLRERITARVSAETIRPLSCKLARSLIQEDLDGALPPLSAGLLRLHLGDCPACWQEHRTLSAATRLVRAAEFLPAPPGIWAKALAGRRPRPAVSWGVRLRPALAAAAMAAGALAFLFHSQPQLGQIAAVPDRQVAPRPTTATPAPTTTRASQPPAPAGEELAVPAPVEATAAAPQSAVKATTVAVLPRPSGTVRPAVVRTAQRPEPPIVIEITTSRREEAAPKTEIAAAPAHRSRGLQALAMMAKAVSSESEGRISLVSELEPWQVFGDEAASEAPAHAVRSGDSPGADSSDSPAQPGTGASGPRPCFAGMMDNAA